MEQFVESESTFTCFHAVRAYLEVWDKPVAFYSDKHGVFQVNIQARRPGRPSGTVMQDRPGRPER